MYLNVSCPFLVNSSVFKEHESVNPARKIAHAEILLGLSQMIILLVMEPFNCLVNVSCLFL